MNEKDAFHAAGALAGAIGGFSEAALEVFVAAFERLDDGPALIEVCEEMARTWEGERPALAVVINAYVAHPRVRAARATRTTRASTTAHCDGTGFIRLDGGPRPETEYAPMEEYRPCPRCNPYLSDVHSDRARWARYLVGVPLYELHPDVKWNNHTKQMTIEGGTMPPRCQVESRFDRNPSFAEGRVIAYRAMLDDLAERGATEEQVQRAIGRFGDIMGTPEVLPERPTSAPDSSAVVREALKQTARRIEDGFLNLGTHDEAHREIHRWI